jgi:hypothetical protein
MMAGCSYGTDTQVFGADGDNGMTGWLGAYAEEPDCMKCIVAASSRIGAYCKAMAGCAL